MLIAMVQSPVSYLIPMHRYDISFFGLPHDGVSVPLPDKKEGGGEDGKELKLKFDWQKTGKTAPREEYVHMFRFLVDEY